MTNDLFKNENLRILFVITLFFVGWFYYNLPTLFLIFFMILSLIYLSRNKNSPTFRQEHQKHRDSESRRIFYPPSHVNAEPDLPDEKRIVRKKQNNTCAVCSNNLKVIEDFYCRYCSRYHCAKHRLPEDHNCINPTKPKDLHAGRILYSKGHATYLRE